MSLLLRGALCTTSPSAVTASTASMDRHAGPSWREFQPYPPPSRNPARPTSGPWPTGKNSPCGTSASCTSLPTTPACTLILPAAGSTVISRSRDRSSSRPPSCRCPPHQLCPPERDLEALGAGVPDRRRGVILSGRDHDEIGIPGRLARVPHRVLAGLLVARFAAPEHRACNPLQPAKTHVGPHLVLETPLARCVHDGRGALFADVRKAGWRSANSNSACQPWPGAADVRPPSDVGDQAEAGSTAPMNIATAFSTCLASAAERSSP